MADNDRLYVTLNGAALTFASYEEVAGWRDGELAAWRFLENSDQWDGWGFLNSRLNELTQYLNELSAQRRPLSELRDSFQNLYNPGRTDGAIYSGSELGRRILALVGERNPMAAAFAYAFQLRRANLGNARSPDDLAAAMIVAMPDLGSVDTLTRHYAAEREKNQHQVTRELGRLGDEGRQRQDEWASLQGRLRQRYLRWLTRGMRRIANVDAAQTRQMHEAVSQIRATDEAYKEAMRLRAPVDYWTQKAKAHKTKEDGARARVIVYFSLLIPAITTMFVLSAKAVLTEEAIASQLYIVVGAGLATIIGSLFWVGRLLTRLYLSEHHLRHDAEERAVMTETYLALTHEQAAQDIDRQIVLTQLFRSTPDGIVKDDGPPDASLAALVSRIASGKAP